MVFMADKTKTSWADDVDVDDGSEDFVDENGIRTTVEYVINEDGKKVKARRVFVIDDRS